MDDLVGWALLILSLTKIYENASIVIKCTERQTMYNNVEVLKAEKILW